MEADPPEDWVGPVAPLLGGMNLVRRMADPEGLGIPLDRILRAHLHSYWEGDEVVELLRGRTFGSTPVFIDGIGHRTLRSYQRYSFQTPGELLYFLRNRANPRVRTAGVRFPATRVEIADLLGTSEATYANWEINQSVPTNPQIEQIVRLFRCTLRECEQLRAASRRMRDFLSN